MESEKSAESPLNISSDALSDMLTPGVNTSFSPHKRKVLKQGSQQQFEFPDGGWECSKCQNYNFKGRKECNRCKKPKTMKDLTGKPQHLIRADAQKSPNKI